MFACFLKYPKCLMNPKVCPETSDEGPEQPMKVCRPFYLFGEPPPPHPALLKAALPKWGYFQLCDFHFHFYQVGGGASGGQIRFLLSSNFRGKPGCRVPDTQAAAVAAAAAAAAAESVGKTRGQNHGRPARPYLQP